MRMIESADGIPFGLVVEECGKGIAYAQTKGTASTRRIQLTVQKAFDQLMRAGKRAGGRIPYDDNLLLHPDDVSKIRTIVAEVI